MNRSGPVAAAAAVAIIGVAVGVALLIQAMFAGFTLTVVGLPGPAAS